MHVPSPPPCPPKQAWRGKLLSKASGSCKVVVQHMAGGSGPGHTSLPGAAPATLPLAFTSSGGATGSSVQQLAGTKQLVPKGLVGTGMGLCAR